MLSRIVEAFLVAVITYIVVWVLLSVISALIPLVEINSYLAALLVAILVFISRLLWGRNTTL
jgi:hypothetical protein